MKKTATILLEALVLLALVAGGIVGCGGEEGVYSNGKYEYKVDLQLTWPDGETETMLVEEESPSKVTVTSSRYPKCKMVIEVEERIASTYTAEQLGRAMMTVRDTGQSYVFHSGILPAYAIRGDSFRDVIVTDDFAYVLTRPRNSYGDSVLTEEVEWFGEAVVLQFNL